MTETITIELPEVYAKELAKRDKRIAQLEQINNKLREETEQYKLIFTKIKVAKDALVAAAEYIDPWIFYDD